MDCAKEDYASGVEVDALGVFGSERQAALAAQAVGQLLENEIGYPVFHLQDETQMGINLLISKGKHNIFAARSRIQFTVYYEN